IVVEGGTRGLFLVRPGHVALHARQRIYRGGGRVPRVGVYAGGDSSVRRRIHGRLRPPPARTSRRVQAGYDTATRERARMRAALNAGTSSGFREVIRLPSSTTGLSTYSPPAFLTSIAMEGQQVGARARRAVAGNRSWGPGQIAAAGFCASIASRVKSTMACRRRILSGACPP